MHDLHADKVPHFCAFYLAQIAVLKEMDGKGPFCSLVMAVVVVKDVIVIIAFALNIELIRSVSVMAGFSLYTACKELCCYGSRVQRSNVQPALPSMCRPSYRGALSKD